MHEKRKAPAQLERRMIKQADLMYPSRLCWVLKRLLLPLLFFAVRAIDVLCAFSVCWGLGQFASESEDVFNHGLTEPHVPVL